MASHEDVIVLGLRGDVAGTSFASPGFVNPMNSGDPGHGGQSALFSAALVFLGARPSKMPRLRIITTSTAIEW